MVNIILLFIVITGTLYLLYDKQIQLYAREKTLQGLTMEAPLGPNPPAYIDRTHLT
jgi:hypothetical protein